MNDLPFADIIQPPPLFVLDKAGEWVPELAPILSGEEMESGHTDSSASSWDERPPTRLASIKRKAEKDNERAMKKRQSIEDRRLKNRLASRANRARKKEAMNALLAENRELREKCRSLELQLAEAKQQSDLLGTNFPY